MEPSSQIITREQLKTEAQRLGFSACGVARAEPVDTTHARAFHEWLSSGNHASMSYMENNIDKRLDPRLLLPGAYSIIVVALNYFPRRRLHPSQLQFAYYAYGHDYHDVMRRKLQALADTLTGSNTHQPTSSPAYKVCCDTVPMLDRYWAWKAGLGWIGKNTNFIIPHAGSFFFLGEIITTCSFDSYDQPMEEHCGSCDRCLRACPTHALTTTPVNQGQSTWGTLDARRCLSYLTIENRDSIPSDLQSALGNYVYGCDRCQLACPYNRFATPTQTDEFTPSDQFLSMTVDDWRQLDVDTYRQLFKGSAVKRAKYEGLLRNIQTVDGK